MLSLLDLCLEKISKNPAREGTLVGLPPYLTDRILELVMVGDNKAILALRLWASLGLSVRSVYIRDSLIDDRILSSLNAFKRTLRHIQFERCEFDRKCKHMLDLGETPSISFDFCRNLTDRILTDVLGQVLSIERYDLVNNPAGLELSEFRFIKKKILKNINNIC